MFTQIIGFFNHWIFSFNASTNDAECIRKASQWRYSTTKSTNQPENNKLMDKSLSIFPFSNQNCNFKYWHNHFIPLLKFFENICSVFTFYTSWIPILLLDVARCARPTNFTNFERATNCCTHTRTSSTTDNSGNRALI